MAGSSRDRWSSRPNLSQRREPSRQVGPWPAPRPPGPLLAPPTPLDRARAQRPPRGQRQREQREQRGDAEDRTELVEWHVRGEAAGQRVAERQQRRGRDGEPAPEAGRD